MKDCALQPRRLKPEPLRIARSGLLYYFLPAARECETTVPFVALADETPVLPEQEGPCLQFLTDFADRQIRLLAIRRLPPTHTAQPDLFRLHLQQFTVLRFSRRSARHQARIPTDTGGR